MGQRVTQVGVEPAYLPSDTTTRVTQAGVEAAYLPSDVKIRVTQVGVEVAYVEGAAAGGELFYAWWWD